MIQMVVVDVRHDTERGRKMKKRSVALIGFGDDILAATELRVSAERIDFSADDQSGIDSRAGQDGGQAWRS